MFQVEISCSSIWASKSRRRCDQVGGHGVGWIGVVFDAVGLALLDAAAANLIVEQGRGLIPTFLHDGAEDVGIAGESLQQDEAVGEAGADAGSRRRGLEVGEELLAHVGLVGDGGIEDIHGMMLTAPFAGAGE